MGWNETPRLCNRTFRLVVQNNTRRPTLSGEKESGRTQLGGLIPAGVSASIVIRDDGRAGEIAAHSEFQARTAAVRMCRLFHHFLY